MYCFLINKTLAIETKKFVVVCAICYIVAEFVHCELQLKQQQPKDGKAKVG